MKTTNNPPENPPAFPMPAMFSPECGTMAGQEGMTLHDYFYAKALQAFIQAAAFNQGAEDMLKKAGITGVPKVQAFICAMAHDFATAAIKERQEAKGAQ